MSRSRRHTKIFGNAKSVSDKEYKSAEHRRERANVRTVMAAGDEEPVLSPKKFGNPWDSRKDGKHYWEKATDADMRK